MKNVWHDGGEMDPCLLLVGMNEEAKMDSRLLMSGMTTTDGSPITTVGDDGEEEDGDDG